MEQGTLKGKKFGRKCISFKVALFQHSDADFVKRTKGYGERLKKAKPGREREGEKGAIKENVLQLKQPPEVPFEKGGGRVTDRSRESEENKRPGLDLIYRHAQKRF